MTPNEIITQTRETAAEWLEMHDNPDQMLIGVLAKKLSESYEHIKYLEMRIQHECANKFKAAI